jgi:hypothetical protein
MLCEGSLKGSNSSPEAYNIFTEDMHWEVRWYFSCLSLSKTLLHYLSLRMYTYIYLIIFIYSIGRRIFYFERENMSSRVGYKEAIYKMSVNTGQDH